LPFTFPLSGRLTFGARPGAISAQVSSTGADGSHHLLQLWESPDGVAWTQRPVPPDGAEGGVRLAWAVMGTEFGYVGYEFVGGQALRSPWRVRYWVLAAGYAWVEVVAPPDAPNPTDEGTLLPGWNQATGSLMYRADGNHSNEGWWIGRFEL